VDVIANGEVVSQLKEGQYFGEIALLEDNCKRTASIRVRRNLLCLAVALNLMELARLCSRLELL
jgi:CRP-like cAMP-binding protein